MRFLRLSKGFSGMFHGEFRLFVPRFVILFTVVNGRGAMRMRRQFVKFRRALMGISWSLQDPGWARKLTIGGEFPVSVHEICR